MLLARYNNGVGLIEIIEHKAENKRTVLARQAIHEPLAVKKAFNRRTFLYLE